MFPFKIKLSVILPTNVGSSVNGRQSLLSISKLHQTRRLQERSFIQEREQLGGALENKKSIGVNWEVQEPWFLIG